LYSTERSNVPANGSVLPESSVFVQETRPVSVQIAGKLSASLPRSVLTLPSTSPYVQLIVDPLSVIPPPLVLQLLTFVAPTEQLKLVVQLQPLVVLQQTARASPA
jgi:hypothetical protein